MCPEHVKPVLIPRVDLRLRVKNKRLSVGIRAEAKRGDTPLFAVIDFTRPDMSGKLWLGGERLHVDHWLALFPDIKVAAIQSETRLDVWADIEMRRIMRAHGKLEIEDLSRIGDAKTDGGQETEGYLIQFRVNGDGNVMPMVGQRIYRKSFSVRRMKNHFVRDVRFSHGISIGVRRPHCSISSPCLALATLDQKRVADANGWLSQSEIRGQLAATFRPWRH